MQLRPSQSDLIKRFRYNPDTGLFIYIVDIALMKVGDIAGSINTNGHVQIMIDEKYYLAHNLAWVFMTGEWPSGFIIDHIDRNYSNNKWNNFRKASLSQNQGNSNLRIDNKTGMKGVYYRKRDNVYVAQITINGKRKYLGQSKDALIAYQMYLKAAELHFGEFSNA